MVLWHYGVVNLQDTLSKSNYGELSDLLVSLEKTFTPKMQETAKRTYQDKVKREKALHLVGCSTGALIRLKKLINRLDNDQYTDAGHVVAFVYMLYVSCPWCRPTICAFFEHSL
jgi:hypothetical protein